MNFFRKLWAKIRGLFSRAKEEEPETVKGYKGQHYPLTKRDYEREPEEPEDMTEGVWAAPVTSQARDLEEVMKSLEFWKFAEVDMQPKLPYVNPDKDRKRHCYTKPKHRRR